MAVKFINLTPHTINIKTPDGVIAVEPSGDIARVATQEEVVASVDGIPLVKRGFGDVEGIPAPQEGTIYIVSALVASATSRPDVVAPDTGPTAVRNEKGHIEYVTRLIKSGS